MDPHLAHHSRPVAAHLGGVDRADEPEGPGFLKGLLYRVLAVGPEEALLQGPARALVDRLDVVATIGWILPLTLRQ